MRRSQLGVVCGRRSVGKNFFEFLHVLVGAVMCPAFVMRPFHAPLAIMPFARLRSQSVPRTRSAGLIVGFPEPAVSTGFVHSLLSALPNFRGASAAPVPMPLTRLQRWVRDSV